MPITMQELARLAGCSSSAVSRVLNGKARGLVSAERRERILRYAREYGYRANPAARGLVQGKTYRLGICVEGSLARHGVSEHINVLEQLQQFSAAGQRDGYAMEIIVLDVSRPAEEIARELKGKAVDGFVFLTWPRDILEQLLFSLKEVGLPAVAAGVAVDDGFTWTDVDREQAFTRATEHLIAEGHERIALLTSRGPYVSPKIAGFLKGMEGGLGVDARDAVFSYATMALSSVMAATEAMLDARPDLTAFLLTTTMYTEIVYMAMSKRGLTPGRDMRLVGFGETYLADKTDPRLTHLDHRLNDQVAFGLEALFEQIEDPARYEPRHRLFRSRLVPRDT